MVKCRATPLLLNTVSIGHDHAARPPQIRTYGPRHGFGGLGRRGRRLPYSGGRRPRQPGHSACACQLSRDGLDLPYHGHPLGARLAGDRSRVVACYRMGPAPSLLGRGEACAEYPRCHPHAGAYTARWPHGRVGHAFERRSFSAANAARFVRRRRAACVARGHGTVTLQAAGKNPARRAQAGTTEPSYSVSVANRSRNAFAMTLTDDSDTASYAITADTTTPLIGC